LKYEEKLLTNLVENYRKSKKDSGVNKTKRRTQLKPEKLYRKYNSNDGDFEEISKLNHVVENLSKKGFVICDKETFGTQILCIYMVDEKITQIEQYLSQKYGYVSKDMQLQKLQNLAEIYRHASPICEKECIQILKCVEARKILKNVNELEDIFRMIAFVEHNREALYMREVSMKVYGDSKYFENETLQSVCSMLRKHTNKPCDETEMLDEILLDYNISKEPQKLCVKGKIVLEMGGYTIDAGGLTGGIEIMASDLSKISGIHIEGKRFMTIENRTSYLRYQENETITFYLGGYANRYQRELVKMVYRDNPGLKYLHFGDIDAGGFWIHHNLCEITGVDFEMYCMSKMQLQEETYRGCLHTLTENDRIRLQELRNMVPYKDVVNYMLENDMKLEQEIISLKLMKKQLAPIL
jgi:hypothetical protein